MFLYHLCICYKWNHLNMFFSNASVVCCLYVGVYLALDSNKGLKRQKFKTSLYTSFIFFKEKIGNDTIMEVNLDETFILTVPSLYTTLLAQIQI